MHKRISVLLLTVLLSVVPAAAQLYTAGNEPGGVRWRQITTQSYKVVYPEGLDSLARVYAANLEKAKIPVGTTAGYTPNQFYKKPLPVILHPWESLANGMVMWTPKRMELLTTPEFQGYVSTPWDQHLAIHESRHVSQMQAGCDTLYRGWNIALGQLFQGAMAMMYSGLPFLEGDAVVAETELTGSGRGRNAEFLEYYRVAFREGDERDWYQWLYGSLDKYAPNHYALGYITMAGMRSVYDTPDFTARYYQRLTRNKRWPFPFLNFPKTVKEVSGKNFKEAFAEVCDTLQERWSRDEAARAPFQPAQQITPARRHYVAYSGNTYLKGTLYSIRRGQADAPQLVAIDSVSKAPRVVSQFSYNSSGLKESDALGRLYWSEIVGDVRWDRNSYSEIWYTDGQNGNGCLKRRTRWFNPSVSPEGLRLSLTEYPVMGGSGVLVADASTGEVLENYKAPDGMQVEETEWVGERLLACALTSGGQGIYDVRDGFRQLLSCGYTTVKGLYAHDNYLYFISDLGGVDELYSFDPESCEVFRISSNPQGASAFRFSPDGGELVFVRPGREGRLIYSTPTDSLPAPVKVDFSGMHRYEFAEELASTGPGVVEFDTPGADIPESEPYNKLANAFRFHSWAPVYIDYNAIDNLSFDSMLSSAGLGAIALFQNELSNLDGMVAYNARYSDHWRHKGEVKLSYRALYPVIELSAGISSDPPSWYYLHSGFSNFSHVLSIKSEDAEGLPTLNASLLMYIPWKFNYGGWRRGLVPQLRWDASNSMITKGTSAPLNRLSASIRWYAIQSTAPRCVYPKLGLGAEVGWSGRPGATGIFNPNAYFYTYGYLPGLLDTHGIRLSGIVQTQYGDAPFVERYASVMPRGMGNYSSLASKVASYPIQSRITADYVFPFAPLDWSGLGPVAYVRNLECTLHGDYAFFGGHGKKAPMHLGGVGAQLCAVLGNLLWIPYDTRIGVQYYYNMGIPDSLNPHQVDMVFSVDF